MNLNIAVVDDTRLDSEKLTRCIHRWFNDNAPDTQNVMCFRDGASLLSVFTPGRFHIVFMDIIMNDLNGIQTAQKIRLCDDKALLIFTTTSQDYAFDAFPLHPFDYIIKPYEHEKLGRVLSDAVNFLCRPESVLNVRISRSTYSIALRDISAVLSSDHFVEVVMSDGKCLSCSMKFGEVQKQLCDDPRFLECNRGVLINMDCTASLTRSKDAFIMNDGSHYPIRVHGRSKVIADFTQYQISRMRINAGR